jgi:hypothetical protein
MTCSCVWVSSFGSILLTHGIPVLLDLNDEPALLVAPTRRNPDQLCDDRAIAQSRSLIQL